MKRLIRIFVGLVIALGALNAHARIYNQAELDALLAPIALYPDPLLNNILDAARYPDDVMAAADWSRANPGMQGDAALQAVEGAPWAPSVKSLVAYPDVLARMVESPQWLADLGDAYATHGPYIQSTIQQLRARAQSSGYLQSDANQNVYEQAGQIYVQPVYPTVVYVPYYNPFVVYGTWWWPAYRPWAFRPFYAHPVVVTRVVRPVHYTVTPYHSVPEARRMPIVGSPPRLGHPEIAPPQRFVDRARALGPRAEGTPNRPMPESRRMPIVRSTPPVAQPSAMQPPRFAEHRPQFAQSAPQMHSRPAPQMHQMPAPQIRMSERPNAVGHSGSAQANGNRGGGGWKHHG
ncbi:MAG TPA: DUF3300 domain-containing protein [Burkholderiales bacterium]|nr:DUF3300 domain-containing protein [Burkholderiales bacterium]